MNEDATLPQKTVLIVDDEPTIRKLFTNRLSRYFSILQAEDGSAALVIAFAKHPDLILLDIKMPGMTGFEVLQKIRARDEWGKHVPVIFLTNVELQTDSAYAAILKNEPAYYLMKDSTDTEDLVAKIKSSIKA